MKRIISYPWIGKKYSQMLKQSLENLGLKVQLPPKTTRKTINLGVKNSSEMMYLKKKEVVIMKIKEKEIIRERLKEIAKMLNRKYKLEKSKSTKEIYVEVAKLFNEITDNKLLK